MRPSRSFGLLLAAALAVAPGAAGACSCTNNLTLQQEFDYAWMVFSGRVVEVQPDPFGSLAVVFEPLQRWKGPLDYGPRVVTPLNSAACGYDFAPGEEYLVFASKVPYGLTLTPTPFTHLCSRTSALAGNEYVPGLPAPLVTTPAERHSWGELKIRHR